MDIRHPAIPNKFKPTKEYTLLTSGFKNLLAYPAPKVTAVGTTYPKDVSLMYFVTPELSLLAPSYLFQSL